MQERGRACDGKARQQRTGIERCVLALEWRGGAAAERQRLTWHRADVTGTHWPGMDWQHGTGADRT